MIRRALVAIALALVVWSSVVYVTGGISVELFGLRMSSRSGLRPLVGAVLLLGVGAAVYGRRSLDAEVERLFAALGPATPAVPALVAIGIVCLGLVRGILTPAGADAYGYLSQAELWLRHELRVEQPFVQKLPLPYADWNFSPLGYRPVTGAHAIVPTYPPGLPILMAVFKTIAGPRGPYLIVPILGGLCVWLCYLLGARAGSPLAGAIAAVLLAASPVFLFQLMWPMSDIPAAAFWTAALVCALGTGRYSSVPAGLCTAIAVAIRPNTAPLAAIPLAYLFWTGRGWRTFIVATLPAFGLIGALNTHLYGSPLASGYGDLGALYKLANAWTNVRRYGRWLLTTETPVIALALVALAKPPRIVHWLLAAFAAGVFAAYVFYSPFDDWWYLRFLLPALPALLVLTAVGALWALGRLAPQAQAVVFWCGATLLLAYQVNFAVSRGVLDLREGEQRYETVGRYAAASTPPNAVFISLQHCGSVRYYSGRLTLRYDWLPGDWLDRAIVMLREQGYRPYILLEDWEEPVFKRRFAQSATGQLAWPPLVEFKHGMAVRLYEPP